MTGNAILRSTEGVIRGRQRPSEAVRGHQRLSEAVRGRQRPSEAVRGRQRPSEAVKGGRQRPSIWPRWAVLTAEDGP